MTEERRAARRQQVYACLEAKNYPELRGLLREMNPADIGSLFEDIEPNVQPVVFRLLPKATAAVAFSYMEAEEQENLLRSFTDKELEDVMREMYIDDIFPDGI